MSGLLITATRRTSLALSTHLSFNGSFICHLLREAHPGLLPPGGHLWLPLTQHVELSYDPHLKQCHLCMYLIILSRLCPPRGRESRFLLPESTLKSQALAQASHTVSAQRTFTEPRANHSRDTSLSANPVAGVFSSCLYCLI